VALHRVDGATETAPEPVAAPPEENR